MKKFAGRIIILPEPTTSPNPLREMVNALKASARRCYAAAAAEEEAPTAPPLSRAVRVDR